MIHILLMLAARPGPDRPGPGRAAELRASDVDRDIAADILCAAVGDGRLSLDELDERLAVALSARTIAELAALIADLPARPCAPAPQPATPPTRWSLVQSLIDAGASPGGR